MIEPLRLAKTDLERLRQLLGEPTNCWAGRNGTLHWWLPEARVGDRCLCGSRTLTKEREVSGA